MFFYFISNSSIYMKSNSRKYRIEKMLSENFSPILLVVRDDSKMHEGHQQVDRNSKETHFFIKMRLKEHEKENRLDLHKRVYKLLSYEFASGLHALELDLKNS